MGKFVDRDLYIVVYGLDGVVLAHGANASRVGTNQIDDKDPDGKAFVKERVELAKQEPELLAVLQIHEPGDQEGRAQANVLRAAGRDGGLRRHLSIGEAVEATMRQRMFLLLAALAALTGAGVFTASAQEDATNIVADQIRAQGYKCNSPQSAKQDTQASKPDEAVWILQCESGSYRVRLIPDMAAKVEQLDKSEDTSK